MGRCRSAVSTAQAREGSPTHHAASRLTALYSLIQRERPDDQRQQGERGEARREQAAGREQQRSPPAGCPSTNHGSGFSTHSHEVAGRLAATPVEPPRARTLPIRGQRRDRRSTASTGPQDRVGGDDGSPGDPRDRHRAERSVRLINRHANRIPQQRGRRHHATNSSATCARTARPAHTPTRMAPRGNAGVGRAAPPAQRARS